MEKIKLLILEDVENDMELIRNEIVSSLKYECVFKWVINKNDFINAIDEFCPDIILSDYNLPQFNGIEAIKITFEKNPLLPFIIVTGTLTEEVAAESILSGAWDYVVKERLHRLPLAIENALKLKNEKEKVLKTEEELKFIKKQTGLQIKLLFDAINHAPSAIVIIDNEGTVLYANPKFTEVTGFKCEEVVGKYLHLLKEGMREDTSHNTIWTTIFTGKEWAGELINKKKNGQTYWARVNISPILDENNNIVNFIVIEDDITELKEKENKLKNSENWYRSLFGNTGTATCILDGDGKILLVNPKFEELSGLSKSEIEGKRNWQEFVAKEDLERMWKFHNERREIGKEVPKKYEFSFIDSKGKNKDILLSVDIIKGTNKSIASLLDISDRKKMEDELKASEQKFRLITENITDLIAVLDLNGNRIYNSPSYSHLLGNPDTLVGSNSFINIHPEDRSRVKKIFKETVEKGIGETVEYRMITKDGNVRYIESLGDLIYDGKGNKSQVVVVSRDISERKQIESTLEAERILLRTVIDNLPVAIYVKDNKFRKVILNRADLVNIGMEEKDVIGKNDYELFPPEIASKTYGDDEYVVKTGKPILNKEEYLINANGRECWVLTSKIPLYDKDKQIKGLVGIAHDITENKKMIKELVSAKERAEEMNRIKTIFLANMSHELRTPLVGLLGFSELLCNELEGEYKNYADMINSSGERLLRTLSAILDYSKIEAEKIELNNKNISLIKLINDEVKLYTATAINKGIQIQSEISVEELNLITDEKLLREIIDNLINNAVKFTDNGFVKVSLKKENDTAIIKVQDTGIGIPTEKIGLVFEEFRQASEGDSRIFQGTGLGLTLVRRYISLLNGSIKVESEVGVGSTFLVYLPIINPSKDSVLHLANDKKNQVETINHTAQNIKKILLVEDDKINQLAIKKMLTPKYIVDSVSNAINAINTTREKQYDVILMDINLGEGMNGMEAACEIKKIDGYKDKPIVAITAYAMDSEREKFLSSGCSHYLSKPFKKQVLLDLLNSISGTSQEN